MVQILGYLFEGIGALAGFIASFLVLRKDRKYVGNRLMATSTFLIGLYLSAILIYDLIKTELIIQIFYRIGMISIFSASFFFYITMQVMVHSSVWLKNKGKMIPWILIIIVYAVWISVMDVIEIVDLETANTKMDLSALIVIALGVLSLLLLSILDLYFHGVKQVSGDRKKSMTLFMIGLIICLVSIFISVGSSMVSSEEIGYILDLVFFASIAVGMILITIGFAQNPKKKLPNE